MAQGVPYSIAAIEDFIAIGSSDGSVRLFDHGEQEIKTLIDKTVKNNAVTCLDIKRIDKNNNIFVVSGHQKGAIAIYEIKGVLMKSSAKIGEQTEGAVAWYQEKKDNLFGNVSFKHHKTIEDLHKTTVVSIKFVGDFS